MIKLFNVKIVKIFIEILIISLVVVAVLLGLIRSLFSYTEHYHAYFERQLSLLVHEPVKIEGVQASWEGWYPTITFTNIIVFNATRSQELLRIKNFQLGINVIDSLIHWQLKPSSWHIIGTHFTVHQYTAQQFTINGIPLPIDMAQTKNNTHIQTLLHWLLSQGEIAVYDVDIDWYGQNNLLIPITGLKLKLNAGLFKHQAIGAGMIATKVPAHFRFVINLKGNNFTTQNIEVSSYFYLKNLELAPWLTNRVWHGLTMHDGRINKVQMWLTWSNKQLREVQTVFDIANSQLSSLDQLQRLSIDNLLGHVVWQRNQNGWNLAADNLRIKTAGKIWPLHQLTVRNEKNPYHQRQAVQIDTLALAPLLDLMPFLTTLPDQDKAVISALHPQGLLTNLLITRDVAAAGKAQLALYGVFKNVSTVATGHFPGIQHLNGSGWLTPDAGEVHLAGKGLNLNFGSLLPQPLVMTNYSGQVDWLKNVDGWSVQAQHLVAADSALSMQADMRLSLPANGESAVMQLLASFHEHDIAQVHRYLPVGIMHKQLVHWLQSALVSGHSIDGDILLQGPLKHFPFDDRSGRFEALLQIQQANLNYASGWPPITALNATVLFDQRRLQIDTQSARIMHLPTTPLHAEIKNLAAADLIIQGGVNADAKDGERFILASPLNQFLGSTFKYLSISGPIQVNLGLEVPLHSGVDQTVKVQGAAEFLPGVMARVPEWNLVMTQLQGTLNFTENSLASNGLKAAWLNQPVNIAITTNNLPKASNWMVIKLNTAIAIADLQKSYGLNFLKDFVAGASDFTVQLQLLKNKNHLRTLFMLDSDLQGIELNLPDPLKKAAGQKSPLHVETELPEQADNDLIIRGDYNKKVTVALAMKKDSHQNYNFKSGNIRFGTVPAVIPATTGWLINGSLERVDWANLAPYLTNFSRSNSTSTADFLALNQINLQIGQLQALGMTLQQVIIQLQASSTGWTLVINSPDIMGRVFLPKQSGPPIQGDFQRFVLRSGATQAVAGMDPGKIPPLDFVMHNFYYNQKSLGEIALNTSPQGNAMRINKLSMTTPYATLSAFGQWQGVGENQQTTLKGQLNSEDIGKALTAWDITKSLVNGRGQVTFTLAWPSAAYDFSLSKLNGNFNLLFKKGRIINISQSSETEMGLGRVLNLLSLQSLPRRLSLDFTDLTSAGFSFDTVAGDFDIRQGNMTTTNSALQGPIAKIAIKGRIGLGAKDYDLLMQVTPFVTSSLPVVATIAGGPLVGAAAWVANKVLGGVVNKIASQTYKVSGSWDDPQMEKISLKGIPFLQAAMN